MAQDWNAVDDSFEQLHGKRILVAEDMIINAEILKQMLMSSGMKVDIADNGRKVVELFSESEPGSYDAIFMDIRMPGMDGLEATREIRSLQRPDAGTVPIIALTANDVESDVEKSMEAGMNAHLTKPVEPDEVYRTLEQLVAG